MLKFNKTNLALKQTEESQKFHIVEQEKINLIPFQVYQIGIMQPENWHVFINSSKPFDFYDGFAKIDRSTEKKSSEQASLSLRWAKLEKDTNIDEYMDELKKQYQKKQKKNKKDHFEIVSIDPVEGMPHKSYLMFSSIRANHSVYRSLGKEETICSMQLTTYCDVTKRLVIASIASTEEDIKNRNDIYKEILFSLTCH